MRNPLLEIERIEAFYETSYPEAVRLYLIDNRLLITKFNMKNPINI